MATGRRDGYRGTQFEPKRIKARAIDLDPSAGGLHQGAQPSCCNSDAVYMAATDQTPEHHRALAPREPYIHEAPCTRKRRFAKSTPIIVSFILPSSPLRGAQSGFLEHHDAVWGGRQPSHLPLSATNGVANWLQQKSSLRGCFVGAGFIAFTWQGATAPRRCAEEEDNLLGQWAWSWRTADYRRRRRVGSNRCRRDLTELCWEMGDGV